MLVLSRKPGETIVIGQNIIVTVAAIQGNRVKLALQAPDDVSIWRGEVAVWQQLDTDLAAQPAEWREIEPVPIGAANP